MVAEGDVNRAGTEGRGTQADEGPGEKETKGRISTGSAGEPFVTTAQQVEEGMEFLRKGMRFGGICEPRKLS